MNLIKHIKSVIISAMLFLLPAATVMAQATTAPNQHGNMDEYSKLAGAVAFLLIAFLFILFLILSAPKFNISEQSKVKELSAIRKFMQKITQSIPLEKEKDFMLDHDFDGIRELDNKIPPWYNALFLGTIIFAIVYFIMFHVTGSGKLMADEYIDEMKTAQLQREEMIKSGAFVNENTVTLLTDAASLENGKTTFTNNCIVCHGPGGGGLVGPNLTDDYWIHGGGIKNIFKTIKYGVPIKGMISWQTQFNPKKMQEVASYVIISLHGTNPPGGKPPEGQVWIDSTKTAGDTSKTISKKIDSTKIDLKTDTTKKGK